MTDTLAGLIPHDAEYACCAAAVADAETVKKLREMGANPVHWNGPKTSLVIEAVFAVDAAGKTVDRASVADELRKMGVYGDGKTITPAYLHQLDRDGVPSIVATARQKATTVMQHAAARKM